MFYVFSRKAVKKSLKLKVIRVWSRFEMAKKKLRLFLNSFREKEREFNPRNSDKKNQVYDVTWAEGNLVRL